MTIFTFHSRILRPATVALALTALTGCSAVPDALNPAEWYNNTVDFFSGEDDQGQVAAQENPGENQPFPNLAAVPKRPVEGANQGLVADVEGRKYAESIARQGEAPAPAMAKAAPVQPAPVAPAQPAPPASPVISVTPVPAAPPRQIAKVQAPVKVTPPQPQPPTQMAALPAARSANSMPPYADDPFATVVVSSNGVEMNGRPVSLPEKPASVTRAAVAANDTATVAPARRRMQVPASGGAKIATILFGNGSYALDSQDRRILNQVVLLQKERGSMVRVVGHSSSRTRNMDPVSHAMVNFKLSVDRANKIAATLVRQGMPVEVLMVDARSDSTPLYSEDMPSGEAGNRRVEVYFVN